MSITARTKSSWSALAIDRGIEICNLNDRIKELEGASEADDDRLRAAANKAGSKYFGCDTPDHLADHIKELEAQIKRNRPEKGTFAEAYEIQADHIVNVNRKLAELKARLVDVHAERIQANLDLVNLQSELAHLRKSQAGYRGWTARYRREIAGAEDCRIAITAANIEATDRIAELKETITQLAEKSIADRREIERLEAQLMEPYGPSYCCDHLVESMDNSLPKWDCIYCHVAALERSNG